MKIRNQMQSEAARAEIRDQLRANQGLPKFVGRETCYVDVFARSECGACTGIMIIFIFLFTICGLTSVPLDLIRLWMEGVPSVPIILHEAVPLSF